MKSYKATLLALGLAGATILGACVARDINDTVHRDNGASSVVESVLSDSSFGEQSSVSSGFEMSDSSDTSGQSTSENVSESSSNDTTRPSIEHSGVIDPNDTLALRQVVLKMLEDKVAQYYSNRSGIDMDTNVGYSDTRFGEILPNALPKSLSSSGETSAFFVKMAGNGDEDDYYNISMKTLCTLCVGNMQVTNNISDIKVPSEVFENLMTTIGYDEPQILTEDMVTKAMHYFAGESQQAEERKGYYNQFIGNLCYKAIGGIDPLIVGRMSYEQLLALKDVVENMELPEPKNEHYQVM